MKIRVSCLLSRSAPTPALYRGLMAVLAPLALRYRLCRGREDRERFKERLGQASQPRPSGRLVWIHAASVGEAMSVLSLIRAIAVRYPTWAILLTTGTITSARLLATRLPAHVIHQFVPVDNETYVTRFLDHWQPDLALWVESELWPTMLGTLKQRKIRAVLLNGRMSAKSYRHWSLVKGFAQSLMDTFAFGLAQTEAERERFAALGLRDARAIGNLKYAAEPLPCNEEERRKLKALIGARPVWLMASTHEGEDCIAIQAHKKLREQWPAVLTIVAPRHPARGNRVAQHIAAQDLSFAQRSKAQPLTPETGIYLADTMGELGLFYRLAPITCLGGSFVWGGHNPIEPAQLDSALLFGPRMTNFEEMAREFLDQSAALQVADAAGLAQALDRLLAAPEIATRQSRAAQTLLQQKRSVLDRTLRLLEPFFLKR